MKKLKLNAIVILSLIYWIGMGVPPTALAALTPPVPINTTNNIPLNTAGNGIIKNKEWAIILGKALFWDIQAGSDKQACASCHFSAGADSRIRNQLSPGFLQKPTEDTSFGSILSYDGEIIPGAHSGLTKSQEENGNKKPLDATYKLLENDFPLHHIADYKDRNSPILITTNDAISSSGAYDAVFGKLKKRNSIEKCKKPDPNYFHAGKYPGRQVEPRNTPTTINAAFNFLNFLDGRASHNFNGIDPFGKRTLHPAKGDPNKRLVVLDDNYNAMLGSISVENASLASQAVGPPLSALEMSCSGKTFPDLGRKMLSGAIKPLQLQRVDPYDSVFGKHGLKGNLIHASGKGLGLSYTSLIQRAFEDKYWKADNIYKIASGSLLIKKTGEADKSYFTQMENNFSMFWGLAIQMYEETLVSDKTPFDTWFAQCRPIVTNPLGAGSQAIPIANPIVQCRATNSLVADPAINPATLVPGFGVKEVLGFGLFNNGGVGIRNAGNLACGGCHPVTSTNVTNAAQLIFPVFSEAQYQAGQIFVPVERSRIDDRGPGTPAQIEGAVHDRGFFNIGVTPTSFDPGIGGTDPYGSPLSLASMFISEQAGEAVTDPSGVLTSTGVLTTRCNTATLIEGGGTPIFPGCTVGSPNTPPTGPLNKSLERYLIGGSFKTPTVRNVALTPPYFHNGGYSNLRQVVEFYARGGSRRDKDLVNNGYTGDTSGTGPLGKNSIPVAGSVFGTNVDFFIRDVKSTNEQIDAIVAFMLTLTDENVRCDAGVFDHPELPVFNGHKASDLNKDKKADDFMARIPAVGSGGYAAAGKAHLCLPNTGDFFDVDLRNRLIQ